MADPFAPRRIPIERHPDVDVLGARRRQQEDAQQQVAEAVAKARAAERLRQDSTEQAVESHAEHSGEDSRPSSPPAASEPAATAQQPAATAQQDEAHEQSAPASGPAPIALNPLAAAKARLEREAKRSAEQQRRSILLDMLDVFDDLDRAVQAASDSGADEGPLWDGICLVRDSFVRKLEKHGAQLIDSDERSFDPALHEAVAVQSVDAERAGQIVRTLQRGFTVGDELLRPARVIVGKAA